jgi:hypothetical protein
MNNTLEKLLKNIFEINTVTQFSVSKRQKQKQKIISGQTCNQLCSPLTIRHLNLPNSISEYAQTCCRNFLPPFAECIITDCK